MSGPIIPPSIVAGEFFVNKGFDLSIVRLREVDCFFILRKQYKRKYGFFERLFTRRPQPREVIARIWFNNFNDNHGRTATKNSWPCDVYGRENLKEVSILTQELASSCGGEIHIALLLKSVCVREETSVLCEE